MRRKFLKSNQTEAGYVNDLMERIALSHPDVSFKFINNGQIRLHTSGNGQLKDIIYHIYGRDIAANLLEVQADYPGFSVEAISENRSLPEETEILKVILLTDVISRVV